MADLRSRRRHRAMPQWGEWWLEVRMPLLQDTREHPAGCDPATARYADLETRARSEVPIMPDAALIGCILIRSGDAPLHPHQRGCRIIFPFSGKALLMRLEGCDTLSDLLTLRSAPFDRLQPRLFGSFIGHHMSMFRHGRRGLLKNVRAYQKAVASG
jgi:hypothetical protein